jgi:hypothetical protein
VSASTGPILAVGGITLANRVLFNDEPMDWRIPIATGIAAGGFALLEKAWPGGAVALAWTALVAVLFTRLDPRVPAPAETLSKWFNK